MKMDHNTALAARRELYSNGYMHAFSPPGAPQVWRKADERRVIIQRGAHAWEIMHQDRYERLRLVEQDRADTAPCWSERDRGVALMRSSYCACKGKCERTPMSETLVQAIAEATGESYDREALLDTEGRLV